jgi:hypothetical protein
LVNDPTLLAYSPPASVIHSTSQAHPNFGLVGEQSYLELAYRLVGEFNFSLPDTAVKISEPVHGVPSGWWRDFGSM